MSASHRLTKLRDTTRTEGEALVLLDFAENYSFVCQDAAQSFHWNNLQATLHPVCIYYKSDGNIAHKFMCVICDIIIHDKHGVYTIQHLIIPKIKSTIPNTSTIHYFSDGAGNQYKNKTNFENLVYHNRYFGVNAVWNFFASSHGKSHVTGSEGPLNF